MYLDLYLTPASQSPPRRPRITVRLRVAPWERTELPCEFMGRVIVPSSIAGRNLTAAALLQKPATFAVRNDAVAEAVAQKIIGRARALNDDLVIERARAREAINA